MLILVCAKLSWDSGAKNIDAHVSAVFQAPEQHFISLSVTPLTRFLDAAEDNP